MKHKNNTGAIRFWGISLFLVLWAWPLLTAAQPPAGIRLRAKTTGKSSGEVAVYHLKNKTNAPITATFGPFIIQKKARLQPLYLSQATATIPPKSRLSITATGACIDFSRPLPPAGARLSFPRHFFTVDEMTPIGPATSLIGQDGVSLVPEGHDGIVLTFPGITKTFPYRISPRANPGLFYSYVLAVEEAFGETYPVLKAQGNIETVFSFDPVLEENLLRQVLTWAITSELSSQDYGPEVLVEQIARVYAETYDIHVKDIPESVTQAVEGNSYNIWAEVFAIGEAAKLIQPSDSVNLYNFRDLIRDISKLDPRDSLFIEKVIGLLGRANTLGLPDTQKQEAVSLLRAKTDAFTQEQIKALEQASLADPEFFSKIHELHTLAEFLALLQEEGKYELLPYSTWQRLAEVLRRRALEWTEREISRLSPDAGDFIDQWFGLRGLIELILSGFRIPGPDGKDIVPVMSEADLSRLSNLLEAKRKENERLHPEAWEASKPLRPGSDAYWDFWLLSRKENGFCCEKSGQVTFTDSILCVLLQGAFHGRDWEAAKANCKPWFTPSVKLVELEEYITEDGQIVVKGQIAGAFGKITKLYLRLTHYPTDTSAADSKTRFIEIPFDSLTGRFVLPLTKLELAGRYTKGVYVFYTTIPGLQNMAMEDIYENEWPPEWEKEGISEEYGLSWERFRVQLKEGQYAETERSIFIDGQEVQVIGFDEKGRVILEFAGERYLLGPGESLYLPGTRLRAVSVDPKTGKITFSMDDENWMKELSGK